MIFKSAELRWFFRDNNIPSTIFHSSFSSIKSIKENKRTDLYLYSNISNTGIKIRQGKHELKLRSDSDQLYKGFKLQSWIKWSYLDDQSIVDAIPVPLLSEWIEIKKLRWLKKLFINSKNELQSISTERADQGCLIEFTEIDIAPLGKFFTFGIETFSKKNEELKLLKNIIDHMGATLDPLQSFTTSSYPEFLKELKESLFE